MILRRHTLKCARNLNQNETPGVSAAGHLGKNRSRIGEYQYDSRDLISRYGLTEREAKGQ